jgi:predicted Zn-dependent protease
LGQGQATVGQGYNRYSLEKEAALGKQLAAEVRQMTTPIQSPTVQNHVDRLGQRLAAHAGAMFPFTFSVIAEDPCHMLHEPLALPGGYVFVPAALFLTARDEFEFAGMMAHAIAHVAARHGTRAVTRGQMSGFATVPLVFMGGQAGSCTDGIAVPAGYIRYQRGFEREADALAVQTMARAGFDPNALVRYIERVQPPLSTNRSAAFSAIPPLNQRIPTMTSAMEGLAVTNYPAPVGGEFPAAQNAVRQLIPPNDSGPPSLRRKMPE